MYNTKTKCDDVFVNRGVNLKVDILLINTLLSIYRTINGKT